MPLHVLGIDNVMFAVGDFATTRRFYGEILGFPEKFAFEEAGIVGSGLEMKSRAS
jgi:catechol 2,3-dioxygenase-like lactoylglutathione lyase family enzyme